MMADPEVRYYSDSIRNYMVLSCGSMLEEAGYPVHMLESNDIPGILPVSVRTIEQETLLYFDITAKISLANLYDAVIPSETVLAVLHSLLRLQQSLADYLLDARNVFYSPQYVYCDLGRETFSFVYGPGEADTGTSPFAPLMDYLADHADPADQAVTELCYRLATLAARPEFILREEMLCGVIPENEPGPLPWEEPEDDPAAEEDFEASVRPGDGRDGREAPGRMSDGMRDRTSGRTSDRISEHLSDRIPGRMPERTPRDVLLREAFVQFGDPEPEEQDAASGRQADTAAAPRRNPGPGESLRRKIWISFLVGAASVLCAGSLFILYLFLPLNSRQQFAVIGTMAVSLVTAVIAGALGVRYAYADKPEPEAEEARDVPASSEFLKEPGGEEPGRKTKVFASAQRSRGIYDNPPKEEYSAYPAERYSEERYPEERVPKDRNPEEQYPAERPGKAEASRPERERPARTRLDEPVRSSGRPSAGTGGSLPAGGTPAGKLYGTGSARGKRIDLAELPQTVGSLPGFATYLIQDDSVGQIHARIERTAGGRLRITDLNSPGGTYVNGERLKPNSTEEIYPQDEIRFGRMEFLYRVV